MKNVYILASMLIPLKNRVAGLIMSPLELQSVARKASGLKIRRQANRFLLDRVSINHRDNHNASCPYKEATTKHDQGARVPRYIISPWTQGGNVFTEPADHTSDMLFVEEWAKANNIALHNDQISAWRRSHMSNLVNAFDFDNVSPAFPEYYTKVVNQR